MIRLSLAIVACQLIALGALTFIIIPAVKKTLSSSWIRRIQMVNGALVLSFPFTLSWLIVTIIYQVVP